MSIAIKSQDQVDRVLANSHLLQEVCEKEPAMLQVFLSAATYEQPRNRWRMYTELKKIGIHYVGFYAEHPDLATCKHYEAMVDAIDLLLPDEFAEDVKELEEEEEEIA